MEEYRKDGLEQLHQGNLKENPYKVPEGYFDTFPSRLQEHIQQQQHASSPLWERFIHLMKPQVTMAIGMLIFAFIAVTAVHYLTNNQQPKHQPLPAEYAKMIENSGIESSEQHFIDILLEEEQSVRQEKLEKEAYIDYLMDEGIDYGTLMDEL
jgi:hypothetical protein